MEGRTPRRRTTVFGLFFGIPFFFRFGGKKKEETKPQPPSRKMDMTNSGFSNLRQTAKS